MNKNNIQIDAGNTVIDMDYAITNRNGLVVTAYVNSLSIRTTSITLERIVQVFINSVLAACQSDKANTARVSLEIRQFIDSIRVGLSS